MPLQTVPLPAALEAKEVQNIRSSRYNSHPPSIYFLLIYFVLIFITVSIFMLAFFSEGFVPENSAQVLKLMLRPDVVAVLIHLLQTHKNNVDICEATLGIIQNICFPFSQVISPPIFACCHGYERFFTQPFVASTRHFGISKEMPWTSSYCSKLDDAFR